MLDDALLLTTIHRMSDTGDHINTFTHIYSLWQEIFTHMLDDALLLTTIHRMSDTGNRTFAHTFS